MKQERTETELKQLAKDVIALNTPDVVCPKRDSTYKDLCKKTTCYITNESDYSSPPEEGVLRLSNQQWSNNPHKLEGFEFGDVIINCVPAEGLRKWLHMHIGIRIERIIYT